MILCYKLFVTSKVFCGDRYILVTALQEPLFRSEDSAREYFLGRFSQVNKVGYWEDETIYIEPVTQEDLV